MGWWKRLKAWQKGGIIVGTAHFIIYFWVFLLVFNSPPGESGGGYLLIFMEWPWLGLVPNFESAAASMAVAGIIGTFIYALVGIAIGLLLSEIKREVSHKWRPL